MRALLVLLWLLTGVGLTVYHYDKGPRHIRRINAWEHLQEIKLLEQAEEPDLEEIILQYEALIKMLPLDEDPLVTHQIRLAMATARLKALDIATAIEELDELLTEVANDYGEEAKITRSTREMVGKSHYMAAWLLRSIGTPEEEWRPYAERSRQVFRYLAEHRDIEAYHDYETRVEATVKRMARKM